MTHFLLNGTIVWKVTQPLRPHLHLSSNCLALLLSRLKCISSTGLKAGQSCFNSQCLKFTQKVSFYPFYNIARSTFTLIFASKTTCFRRGNETFLMVSKHYGTTLGRKLTIFIEKFVSQTFWVTFEMKSKQANTVSKKRDVGRRRMKWGIELLFPPAGRSSLNSLFEMRWWQKLRRKLKLSLAKETVNNWAFLLAQFGKGDNQSIANSRNASSSLISTNCAKRISLLLW